MEWSKNGYVLIQNYLGQKLWVPIHAQSVIRRKGILDCELLTCLQDLRNSNQLRKGKCIDAGANIGNHTLFFSKLFDEVIAFEPLAKLLPLSDNIKINEIENVRILSVGLSDRSYTTQIFVSPHVGLGASTLSVDLARNKAMPEVVELIQGDDVLRNETSVALIKVDVEGHEAEALVGLKHTIRTNSPIIVFEWNNEKTKARFDRLGILSDVLKDYTLWGVIEPLDKRITRSKLGRLGLKIKLLFNAKRYVIVPFNELKDYANVLAIPSGIALSPAES
jgi:FkbM family methyltransferase